MQDKFKGHDMVRLSDDWVFDVTECAGYSIERNADGGIINYVKQFYVEVHFKSGSYKIQYTGKSVPFGIIRKACNTIAAKSEGLINNVRC